MNDLISVIIPIYGVEPYLEQCIRSVRNQTYKNLEIILVCRESNDRCLQICKHYACEDRRVKVIRQKNVGLDSARKEGILQATGKYIGYVDGDDWIEPVMYEELLKYAHNYKVDVVESGAIDSWENRETRRTPYLDEGCYVGDDFVEKVESKLLYSGVFFEHGISPYMWSKLFLKEKLLKYQMAEGMTNIFFDDVMVSLPCIVESKKLYISHSCYYHYRVRNDSLKRDYKQGNVEKLKKCYSSFFLKFSGSLLCGKNDKQIKSYALYWLLLWAPHIFDSSNNEFFLKPFGNINIRDRIVLYGAGAAGIHLEQYIRSVEGSRIVCWLDRNYESLQEILNVKGPEEIVNYQYDYVVIAILRGCTAQKVKNELIRLGIPNCKIRWIKQEYIDNPEILLNGII